MVDHKFIANGLLDIKDEVSEWILREFIRSLSYHIDFEEDGHIEDHMEKIIFGKDRYKLFTYKIGKFSYIQAMFMTYMDPFEKIDGKLPLEEFLIHSTCCDYIKMIVCGMMEKYYTSEYFEDLCKRLPEQSSTINYRIVVREATFTLEECHPELHRFINRNKKYHDIYERELRELYKIKDPNKVLDLIESAIEYDGIKSLNRVEAILASGAIENHKFAKLKRRIKYGKLRPLLIHSRNAYRIDVEHSVFVTADLDEIVFGRSIFDDYNDFSCKYPTDISILSLFDDYSDYPVQEYSEKVKKYVRYYNPDYSDSYPRLMESYLQK